MTVTTGLDFSVIGKTTDPSEVSWDETDVMLYALAVGAGQQSPGELNLTTENTEGVSLQVVPSFVLTLTQRSPGRSGICLGSYDPEMLVHAEQQFAVLSRLPTAGTMRVSSTVTGIYDKGSGALAVIESVGADAVSGAPLYRERSSVFIRGAGGFGGVASPRSGWDRPDRPADAQVSLTTRPEQALLYRLCADRHPLHSDPAFAGRGGFSRPILHGLCTYGFTARALIGQLCDGDPDRLVSMDGRFVAPVFPGESLDMQMWSHEDAVLFETSTASAGAVLSRGRASVRAAERPAGQN